MRRGEECRAATPVEMANAELIGLFDIIRQWSLVPIYGEDKRTR